MIPRSLRAAAALAAASLALVLASCAPRLGWGVTLWTASEGPLPAGSVVPVYIISNIEKLYVVGVPGTTKKIELPLWQVEVFGTKRKAQARVAELGENATLYMVATRDGIPIRDTPSNSTGNRVFRLKEGQSVKILAKVEGEAVTTGGEKLAGDWYQVIADDGTRGYLFSYAARIYDEAKEGPPVVASSDKGLSGRVDLVFSRSWRPEYFQQMLDDDRVDLDYFSLRYGLFCDAIRRQIRLELPTVSKVFSYTAISEAGGVYSFDGSDLKVRIDGDKRITLAWKEGALTATPAAVAPANASAAAQPSAAAPSPAEAAPSPPAEGGAAAAPAAPAAASASPAAPAVEPLAVPEATAQSAGRDGKAVLVVLSTDVREAIKQEDLRRQRLLEGFADAHGTAWASLEGGLLSISRSRRFAWTERGPAAQAFIPPGAVDAGDVSFRLRLAPAALTEWEGSFSLRFDAPEQAPGESAAPKRPGWLDFVYRFGDEGMTLAPAAPRPVGADIVGPDPRYAPLAFAPVASAQ